MKKILLSFLLLFCLTLTIDQAYADTCSNTRKRELGNAANYVKVDYEVIDKSIERKINAGIDETTIVIPNFHFDISIYNLTEDIYADVVRARDLQTFKVYYKDIKDGIYTFKDYDSSTIDKYTVTIRPANDCLGLTLRTINYTKPKYNAYSEFKYCKNSSSFYCQKFVTKNLSITSTDDFLQKIKANSEKNKPVKEEEKEEIAQIIKSNWILYVIIFIIIFIIAIMGILIVRKYKKDKGWKL